MTAAQRFSVQSATVRGAEAVPVTVEVAISAGLPGFHIVGMPDIAIHEARERVRAALRSCGYSIPHEKIVFNLAPGNMRKTGSGFDLPIAISLLAATDQIPKDVLKDKMIIGELALDGSLRPVNGMVAFQMCAQKHGYHLLCAQHAETIDLNSGKHSVFVVQSLRDFSRAEFSCSTPKLQKIHKPALDYADVGGHRSAKRAMQIAATGNHGILMIGPPGSGKTMLAQRLPSILPPLSAREAGEAACIASIVGEDIGSIMEGIRPFRAPHHSATLAGLIGGGNPIKPGEVSLAHNGVLMLDELSEFSSHVLQGLRQPIEDGKVTITRADGNVVMPAKFMLVAATNPCPCGYFGDPNIACSCPLTKVKAYQNRIGGPLIDRIDICIDVWRSNFDDVIQGDMELSSENLRRGVEAGRSFAFERFQHSKNELNNAGNSVAALIEECAMDSQTRSYFKSCSQAYLLSGRGIMRILRVARTIADIEQSISVTQEHIAEALSLRVRATSDHV